MSQNDNTLQLASPPLPRTQEEVIERLLAEFDELPGQLQLCARYIIDHPHEVGLQSMRTLAQDADVHPNSFVRLARQLGFDGYEAMRERFRDYVRSGTGSYPDRVHWLKEMHRQGGSTRVFANMAEAGIAVQDGAVDAVLDLDAGTITVTSDRSVVLEITGVEGGTVTDARIARQRGKPGRAIG